MRFYADENVPRGAVLRLREAGYDVLYVIERTRRLSDRTIIQEALEAQAIILTQDKDYWQHIILEKRPSFGAVWIRLSGMPRSLRDERIAMAIRAYETELMHCFTVIYPDRVEQLPLE